jgi:Ethanolamine utilization protein EutJ (predicted chaperonin)
MHINNLVSIDIGGGTTDIVFIKDGKKAEYVTSFRFAANSIFGLGEHITPVVSKYQTEIEKLLRRQRSSTFYCDNILLKHNWTIHHGDLSLRFSLRYQTMRC